MTADGKLGGARDAAKPPEYYMAYISRMERSVEEAVKTGKPVMFTVTADYCLRMGRAAYSAGKTVGECKAYLRRGTEYQIRYCTEGVSSKLAALKQIDEYLEIFSAAYLVHLTSELISAFERIKPTQSAIWERALMSALEAVLLGRTIVPDEEGSRAAMKMKEYASLPGLFSAIERGDEPAFVESLEDFATRRWGPPADRAAKTSLKQPYPNYTGKWSFFSAAMCSILGKVPPLSKKALQYVPTELCQGSQVR